MDPGPKAWTPSMCPPAPGGPTACVRQPCPSENSPLGRSASPMGDGRSNWDPSAARPTGRTRRRPPDVRAHQVQSRENQIRLGPQDTVGIVVEPEPPILRVLLAMSEQMPDSQVPLGREPLRGHLHLHGRRDPLGAVGSGGRLPPRMAVTGALPGLFFMSADLLADGAQFPRLEFLDELAGAGRLRG